MALPSFFFLSVLLVFIRTPRYPPVLDLSWLPSLWLLLESALGTMLGMVRNAIKYCTIIHYRYAINPARDLGPRIMISLCGWGAEAFSSHGWWFWIPVVCCHLGGVVGVVVHTVVIEHQWGTESKAAKEETGMEKEETQLTAEV